jgi:mannose-1-phosphate guanylyltransferase
VSKTYACIMAGGSGERFWPLSRIATPKHLVQLLSERTLLEETVRRVERAIPSANIFVLTNAAQIESCRAVLPQLKRHQFVAEPSKRDTAPACALGTALARRLDPDAVVIFLPADALIKDTKTFARQLKQAAVLARRTDAIVTFAIRPGHPSTRFGYLEAGATVAKTGGVFSRVKRFVEKPDAAKAKSYLRRGNYFWNAGIFLWQVKTFVREARRLQPELARFIEAFPSGRFDKFLAAEFPKLPKISVDYAIMEKAAKVVMARAQFDWDDVGSWTALPAHLPADTHGNTLRGATAIHDAQNNIVFSKKRVIALCGVKDLIVVETADAILVCHRDAAEQIKLLQSSLPDRVR